MALLRFSKRSGRGIGPPLVLFAIVTAGLAVRSVRAQPVADEYQVKAAYILNFARFIEWPPDVLPPSAPLNIAIVGNNPFAGTLDSLLRGKSANGHPIRLRYVRWNDSLAHYNIVFITASEESHLQEILRLIGSESVLTVSDIERFSLRGGIVEFSMVGNRVRFDIDRTSAVAAKLGISSKLLNVARAVHEGSAKR
jgi:hypothetical protein